MNSVIFIINPVSGGRKNRGIRERLRRWVSARMPSAAWEVTTGPGDAIRLAEDAALRGVKIIFSVGGDGTVHEILQGIAPLAKLRRPALGVLGTGTGSDYSRGLKEQFGNWADWNGLLDPKERWVDFGKVTMREDSGKGESIRYFINVADVGLSGEVVHRVAQGGKKWGSLQYLVSSLQAAWSYRAPTVRLEGFISSGKKLPEILPLMTAVVAKGRYFGGGMAIAPRAILDDGFFHVMIAGDFSYLDLLLQLPNLYRKRPIRHRNVFYGRATQLRFTALEGSLPVDLDGEPFRAREVELDLCPKGLRILTPSGGPG
jgi:YegS/Rv2252/BmrU family lipid kinase